MKENKFNQGLERIRMSLASALRAVSAKGHEFWEMAVAYKGKRTIGELAKDFLNKIRTPEGRGEVWCILRGWLVSAKMKIVSRWNSGPRGKSLLIGLGVVILLMMKSCIFATGDSCDEATKEAGSVSGGVVQYIHRCQYCFHEKLSGTWSQPPPCIKGHGHSYESIGARGTRYFGCEKCGRRYPLQYRPIGYIHCPCGQACQWREL